MSTLRVGEIDCILSPLRAGDIEPLQARLASLSSADLHEQINFALDLVRRSLLVRQPDIGVDDLREALDVPAILAAATEICAISSGAFAAKQHAPVRRVRTRQRPRRHR